MRIVTGLRLRRDCPAARTWKPIFDAAEIEVVALKAFENVGGCWTLTIPIELKPLFEAGKLRYPVSQSFRTEMIVFVNEDPRTAWPL